MRMFFGLENLFHTFQKLGTNQILVLVFPKVLAERGMHSLKIAK